VKQGTQAQLMRLYITSSLPTTRLHSSPFILPPTHPREVEISYRAREQSLVAAIHDLLGTIFKLPFPVIAPRNTDTDCV